MDQECISVTNQTDAVPNKAKASKTSQIVQEKSQDLSIRQRDYLPRKAKDDGIKKIQEMMANLMLQDQESQKVQRKPNHKQWEIYSIVYKSYEEMTPLFSIDDTFLDNKNPLFTYDQSKESS